MALIIVTAFILDCIIGDPQNRFHPMRLIGSAIGLGVRAYKKVRPKSLAVQFIMGMALSLIIIAFTYTVIYLITRSFYGQNYWLGLAAEAIICYFLIAPKALKDESMKVYKSLTSPDLSSARQNLAFIVGRDTAGLNQQEIVKATVETIAENLADGVIAPLIFIAIGGAPLGMAYKAVNTLDSMIGYRNADFEHFGKFAARLDDVVNFIPARLAALLTILASLIIGADAKAAARIYIRDRFNHQSPNSAQTEAASAGALGLSLGGGSYYQGVYIAKPTIGDNINEPEPQHIISANRLMYAATIIAVVLLAATHAVIS